MIASRWTVLHKLTLSGNYDDALLLENLTDIDVLTPCGSSALHFAVLGGCYDTVKFIIKHDPHVDRVNFFGETPLHWACKTGSKEIVKLLLKEGASITVQDGDGNTPLHWAAEYDNKSIVSLLYSYGASCMDENHDGETPEQVAFLNKSKQCVLIFKQLKQLVAPAQ